jgi:hypothetical protein
MKRNMVTFLPILWLLPETSGHMLEEIEKHFRGIN